MNKYFMVAFVSFIFIGCSSQEINASYDKKTGNKARISLNAFTEGTEKKELLLDHEKALEDILFTINIFKLNKNAEPERIVKILTTKFDNKIKANKLYAFIPMAFGFVTAKKIGIDKFPSEFYLLNRNKKKILFPLAQEHYFTASLKLGYEHLENGWSEQLSKEAFEAVLAHSAEVNALNKALNKGIDVKGSEFQPSLIHGILAEDNES